MKKLRYILISFVSIWILGIIIASFVINSNVETGVHKIEVSKENKSKVVNVTLDTKNDTLSFDNQANLSQDDKDKISSLFTSLVSSLDLEKGKYLIKLFL